MPFYDSHGKPLNNLSKVVAASQTTANISTPSNAVVGRDYCERIIVNTASTLGGIVTLFDGTTALITHIAQVTGKTGTNVEVYEVNAIATSTAGFNITTGSSVACTFIGRF
jgi:hypothetical protein